MSINAINQSIQAYVPSRELVAGCFTTSLPQIGRNLNKLAIPTILLFGLSFAQGAEAGPIAYATCVTACGALFAPLVPVCIASCLPLLAAPTP
jgi:hypothetical protein